MASTTNVRLLKQQQSQRLANARARYKRQATEYNLVRKGSIAMAAGVFGALKRFEVAPDVGGFPVKVGVTALAWIGEAMSSGTMQQVLSGVGDGSFAVYLHEAISTKSLVAGVSAVGAEDDEDEEMVIEAEGGEI